MDLELTLWREACRPLEIGPILDRMAASLTTRVPAGLLLLRRFDALHSRLETVAGAVLDQGVSPPRVSRTDLTVSAIDRLLVWCASGTVWRGAAPTDHPVAGQLVPAGVQGAAMVAPLSGAQEPAGVLVLVDPRRRAYTAHDEDSLQPLAAPFAAALDRDRARQEIARLREASAAEHRALLQPSDISASIVGADTGLRGVMERVELVAPTDAPVLILGETGSGKEVVARAIHARSPRESGPILRVNCGAIPSELIDSELFGHERGSFTGALSLRKGWFERADGGTLFLDEVAELPLAAQVRLLRILQDGSFERVGGQRTLTVDVRIVAATHQDLETMVRERRFREDLWYRISVFPIRLPPLRERREDIAPLAAHFAHRAGMRLGVAPLTPAPGDIEMLLAYDWPGNVRELAAVIERAAILGNGRMLDVAAALGGASPRSAEAAGAARTEVDAAGSVETLDRAMARHIENALRATHGRIEGAAGAARLLDINPHTLRARMRKLGVRWGRFRPEKGA